MKYKLLANILILVSLAGAYSQDAASVGNLDSINDSSMNLSEEVNQQTNEPPFYDFFNANFPKGVYYITKLELQAQYGNPERVTNETDSALVNYGGSKKTIQFQYPNASYYCLADDTNQNIY